MVEITLPIVLQIIQTLSLVVGIFYYITTIRTNQRNQEIALRNQELTLKTQEHTLETRQSQLFMNIYNLSFANPEFQETARAISATSGQIKSADDFLAVYDYDNPNPVNPEDIKAWNTVLGFYEGLGVFVREGLIDIRLIVLTMTGMTRNIWAIIGPFIDEIREHFSHSRWMSEFEYLVIELEKYIEEHPELKT